MTEIDILKFKVTIKIRVTSISMKRNVKQHAQHVRRPHQSNVQRNNNNNNNHTNNNGIQHFTGDYLQRICRVKNLVAVKEINIGFDTNFNDKNNRKIEQMDGNVLSKCKNLEKLCITMQNLTTMRGIEKLSSKCIEIDLSQNNISKIEGIDGNNIRNIEFLDLSGNNINKIPKSIQNLINLRHLKLNSNNIVNINDIFNLRDCNNLTKLDIDKNDICKLSHYREFIIYYLPQLSHLNNKNISDIERNNSKERFNNSEINSKLNEIDLLNKKINENEIELNKNYQNINQLNQVINHKNQQITTLETKIKTLQFTVMIHVFFFFLIIVAPLANFQLYSNIGKHLFAFFFFFCAFVILHYINILYII